MIDNLKRIYKTFHPRENALFVEIDDSYLKDIDSFIAIVKRGREKNDKI